MDINEVIISRNARKQLKKIPKHVIVKLIAWVDAVKNNGLLKTRKIPGFHDEPLKGKRRGERSIRLSKGYRAFYIESVIGITYVVEVIEVNKHEY